MAEDLILDILSANIVFLIAAIFVIVVIHIGSFHPVVIDPIDHPMPMNPFGPMAVVLLWYSCLFASPRRWCRNGRWKLLQLLLIRSTITVARL